MGCVGIMFKMEHALDLALTKCHSDRTGCKDLTTGYFLFTFYESKIRNASLGQLCHNFCQKFKTDNSKMFESLITNIKRKFSKTSDEIVVVPKAPEKMGLKRGLHLFKSKLLKTEPVNTFLPVYSEDDTALSPRAAGTAECAETEIEWPVLIDNNPNILEKFTRIVTITDYGPSNYVGL